MTLAVPYGLAPTALREPWRKLLFPAAHQAIASSCAGSMLEKLSDEYLRELAVDLLRSEGFPLDSDAGFIEPVIRRTDLLIRHALLALEEDGRAKAATPKRGRPRLDFPTMWVLSAAFHAGRGENGSRLSAREAARRASARFGNVVSPARIRHAESHFRRALGAVRREHGPAGVESILSVLIAFVATLSELEDVLASGRKLARPGRLYRAN